MKLFVVRAPESNVQMIMDRPHRGGNGPGKMVTVPWLKTIVYGRTGCLVTQLAMLSSGVI